MKLTQIKILSNKTIFFFLLQLTSVREKKKAQAKNNLKAEVAKYAEKQKTYEVSYDQYKQSKAENENRFSHYMKKLEQLDLRLTHLGEIVEAFDAICK